MKNKRLFQVLILFLTLIYFFISIIGCAVNGEIGSAPDEKDNRSSTINANEGIALEVNSVAFSDDIPIGEGQKYNVRNSFKIALQDWLEYKFGKINESAIDEVNVQILSINYDGGNNTFLKSVSMQIRLTGDINGIFFDKEMTFEQNFSRSAVENPDYKGSTLSVKAKTNLDRYLIQYVEKIKSYLQQNVENLN